MSVRAQCLSSLALLILSLTTARAAAAGPLSADDVVRMALSRHPLVAEASAEVTAAEGGVRAATFLRENPSLSVRVGADKTTREAELAQPLSLTGEGIFARQAATARLAAAEAGLGRARLVAAAEARHLWIAAVVAVEERELTRGALDLAIRRCAAVEARAVAGDVPDLDARLARLGRARAAQDYLVARREEAAVLTELGAWIGRTVSAAELEADPRDGAPSATGDAPERSDVLAAQHRLDASLAELKVERAAVLPRVELGAFSEQGEGERALGPSLSMTLPVWQQNAEGRARLRGEVAIAQADLDRTRARAAAEGIATAAVATDAVELLSTLGPDLAADADAALASVEAGFSAGEIDLTTLLFLQDEILSSRHAFVAACAASADAAVAHLLAVEDATLLGVQP